VVGAALERVRLQLGQRSVEIRIPSDFPLLPVDPTLIEQLLVNLVENALRHTPADSPIELGAIHDGRTALLEILDRGPGLPPGGETRVFEKFYRGPASPPGGSGLGLAICRGIAHAHGGTIEATNRPGGGLLVRVRIPIEGEPPPLPSEEASGAAPPVG
jgi:two-component system sensor histidine kinase KdpD